MFGQNPVRKQNLHADDIWVQSVFTTIQGEGPFAGEAAIFVRLAGCNLKCFWCDTDFESSRWHPDLDGLMDVISAQMSLHPKVNLVVLTGGEPLRQDVIPLIRELLDRDIRVQIETNGTLWIDGLEEYLGRVSVIVSPKTGKLHPMIEQHAMAYKYIVAANECDDDGLPWYSTQIKGRPMKLARPKRGVPIYVQPRDDYNDELNERNEAQAVQSVMKHGYRMSYQLHKHLGLE